jgi:ketosteroid isomerase-like protein
VQVREFGQAAICVGIQAQQTTFQGQDTSGRFRGTLVVVHEGTQWRIAGVHLSPLADASK